MVMSTIEKREHSWVPELRVHCRGRGQIAVLNRVVRISLHEKTGCDQRVEENRGVNHTD